MGSRAKELVGEFFYANSQPSRHVSQPDGVRWCPLPEQHYKGNFDAAFFDDSGCARIKVVFRDHMDQVIVALSQKIPFGPDRGISKGFGSKKGSLVYYGIKFVQC